MRVRHTLICFFFLSLREESTAIFNEDIGVRTGTEGGNITVACTFSLSGKRKIFCRDDCDKGNILVETTGVSNQSGRYSIEYNEGTFLSTSTLLYVSITNLTKSDSGRYSCKLDRSLPPDSSETFELRVKDAPKTTKPNRTLQPFSASTSSTTTRTSTETLNSTSGSTTPSSASQEITDKSDQETNPLPYLGLLLVLLIIILSVILLIYCKKRTRKPKGPPVQTEYADISGANRVYEEIREENRPNTSPHVNISTVYTCAKFSKPNEAETTGDYSLVSAAGPPNKTEDDLSELHYSTVDFPNNPAASYDSAPPGGANNVVYSLPRVEASSEDASPPLYSTVTRP
ncbi:uncharacterized protein LOC117822164 isoform X2 [Notolabrus celidotus]|uniref:uncharacterized protein LOC117822164 isoform X2 n=1 Tax=Notolabrus celidotus TaxID=1203425 RepID=UPI00148FC7A3|nr:uncharacterized protein LOC117822164 isoform X2 [Notolabrus celidotus]